MSVQTPPLLGSRTLQAFAVVVLLLGLITPAGGTVVHGQELARESPASGDSLGRLAGVGGVEPPVAGSIAVEGPPSASVAAQAPAFCLSGDVNADSQVDIRDFLVLIQDFGRAQGQRVSPISDVNGDGEVDIRDFLVLIQGFGQQVTNVTLTGTVGFDTGGGVGGAQVTARADNCPAGTSATTAADGSFSVQAAVGSTPASVLITTTFTPPGMPPVSSARRQTLTSRNPATIDRIALFNPTGAQMTLSGGTATAGNGALSASGLPSNVTSMQGRSYDPVANRDAFPGDFTESNRIPITSAGFNFIQAQTASATAVTQFSSPVTMRNRIPRAQWPLLSDVRTGTDRIDIPIYTYNEQTQMWEEQATTGWLEDSRQTVLPEDAQPTILNGSFQGDVYAAWQTTHFSYMNVDYASIGPWTLSRMNGDQRRLRNNDCFYNAVQLAKTILRSAQGRAAYQQFNTPTGNLDIELADRAGPEIVTEDQGASKRGEFKGNEQGDRDDQLYLNSRMWNGCGDGATADQKKNTTLLMAKVLLHETSHWKWDVKHDGGNWTNPEPGGEAGKRLETTLFGGVLQHGGTLGSGDPLELNGSPITNAQRDAWLNPGNWPPPPPDARVPSPPPARTARDASPLSLTLAAPSGTIPLGTEIPVTVTYTNTSNAPIRVLRLVALEGYPLWFTLVRSGSTTRVPFRGPRVDRQIDFVNDFVTLNPGQTLVNNTNLLRDASGGRLYNLIQSGTYQLTAFYSGNWGLPETQSNTVPLTIGPGGQVSGTVTNATNAQGIVGATVVAMQGTDTLATVTTGTNGSYSIPELPPGSYTVQASAPGFLRSSQTISVTSGATTTANFSLSPLLARGQLRLVLTWGTSPNDLDSHLWTPPTQRYHLYYGRRGVTTACPFANLDVDVTSGRGPETITISQLLSGTYVYAVYNFSGSPDISTSQARVQVFDSTGLIATFQIPSTGTGRWWDVLRINGATGAITEVNQIVADPTPYPDSASCGTTSPPPSAPVDAPKPPSASVPLGVRRTA